jgi:hypothetical protein
MKLLDAAIINPQDEYSDPNTWLRTYGQSGRECAVHLEIEDGCDPAVVNLRGSTATTPAVFEVTPFFDRGFLRRSTKCEREDDMKWFMAAFEQAREYVTSKALVVQAIAGSVNWIGAAGVQSVALGATPTAQERVAAISAARDLWFRTVTSPYEPVMHVPPSLAPELVTSGVLQPTAPNEVSSVWGDNVVITAGYQTATPKVFFTPKLVIRTTATDEEGGRIYRAQLNSSTITLSQGIAIELNPCTVVRVGS